MARLVSEADLVVHLGGMVPPAADQDPVRTRRVNVGAMRNIVAGVKALPDPGRVTVVGVGSVAQTGPRPQPVHWGRVGDPLRASDMDLYAQSKIAAERILVDSGLPRWTWLRQTGMLSASVLRQRDPIALHVPLDGVIEWVSDLDSARLLARIALGECDESLFARVHNIGGGQAWRLTNWEILTRLARAMGARGISQWYERNWFATGNFHGHWFTDSDALEQIVPFRSEDPTTATSGPCGRSSAHGRRGRRSGTGQVSWCPRPRAGPATSTTDTTSPWGCTSGTLRSTGRRRPSVEGSC